MSAADRPVDLVFDLDGTISDPSAGIAASINHALAACGFATVANADIHSWIGAPLEDALRSLSGDADAVSPLVDAYRERYGRVGYAENELYPDARETLRELAKAGATMGVCTSKRADFAERILKLFEIRSLFEFVSGGDIGVTKASQLTALKKQGAVDSTSIMIGDRDVDVSSAQANGMRGVGVAWGFAAPGELEQAGALRVLGSPREAPPTVFGKLIMRRQPRMRVVVFLGVMLLLGGCDIATDLFETPAAVEADFEAQHGLTVSTGFNLRNGRLETVTLQFVAGEVEDLSLADLQTVSEPIVLRHFERAPRHLILAVAVDGRTMRDRIRE